MWEDIISLPQNKLAPEVFNLELAGISYCDGSYRISRSSSPIYVFEYVLKGRGFLKINSLNFEPEQGDVYIAHYGSRHIYGSSGDDPWTKIWFNVSGSLPLNLMETYGLNTTYHIPDCPVEEIFNRGLSRIKADISSAHSSAALVIHEIIMAVADTLSSRKSQASRFSEEAKILKDFLDKSSNSDISLGEMAKFISKSESQTIRIFRNAWGITPYKYLLEKKLRQAKILLCNTAKPVKGIAYELGFSDEYYFSNIFRKKTGIYPSIYRKQQQVSRY